MSDDADGDDPSVGGPRGGHHPPRWLVVIGSSAGGIEALGQLLGGLSVDLDAAYVIAQHRSPTRVGPLVELLARDCPLAVQAAVADGPLVAGVVSVIPPNFDATVSGGALRLTAPADAGGPRPNIDALFRSAADSYAEHAVAVVLSGSGSDGATGVQAIRAAGGVVIAENAAAAAFDSMPLAAVATGGVDLVLDPGEIGAALSRVCTRAIAVPRTLQVADDGFEPILASVRAATARDFSGYKEATVRRQIGRRQAITETGDLAAYGALVASDPDEAHALVSRLLVSVTSFFRDPPAWDSLRKPVVECRVTRSAATVPRLGARLRHW